MSQVCIEPLFVRVIRPGVETDEPIRYECQGRQWLRHESETALAFKARVQSEIAATQPAYVLTVLGFDSAS